MWVEFNPNPVGRKVGDCSVRAISKALNIPWDDAFDPINGVNFGDDTVQLNQRTFDGIIADCERAINNHMKLVTNTLMSNLENGYVNTSKGGR